ncbi:MAG: DNA repair protein RadC [Clostridia bacterium]|nr:DNA repair protein RadC [Clostridia bacterium]
MSENLHEGHRERIREQYRKQGMNGMADHVVLEYLLTYVIPRKDVNELAHRLLNTFGSLTGVLEADPQRLSAIDGVGEKTALFLHSLYDLHRRLTLETAGSRGAIRLENPESACRYALALSIGDRYETLRIICLDTTMKVLHTETLQVGTLSHVSFEPRRVIETALTHKARYLILTHNHPSGVIIPSADDIETAKMIEEIGSRLEIDVRDQLILSKNAAYSYQYDRVFLYSTPAVCNVMSLEEYNRTLYPISDKSRRS